MSYWVDLFQWIALVLLAVGQLWHLKRHHAGE